MKPFQLSGIHPFFRCISFSTLMAVAAVGLTGAQAYAASAVTVTKDQSLRVELKGAASAVVVANPKIADVTVVDSRTVYILGRDFGTTSITIADANGRSLWDAEVTVGTGTHSLVTINRGGRSSLMLCKPFCTENTDTGSAGSDPSPGASGLQRGAPVTSFTAQ
jgi:hypothetical protein